MNQGEYQSSANFFSNLGREPQKAASWDIIGQRPVPRSRGLSILLITPKPQNPSDVKYEWSKEPYHEVSMETSRFWITTFNYYNNYWIT